MKKIEEIIVSVAIHNKDYRSGSGYIRYYVTGGIGYLFKGTRLILRVGEINKFGNQVINYIPGQLTNLLIDIFRKLNNKVRFIPHRGFKSL